MTDHAKIGPTSWVNTRADLSHLLEAIASCEEVVLDAETTGLIEYAVTGGHLNGGVAARVSLIALTLPMAGDAPGQHEPTTYIVPLSHPDSPWLGSWRYVLARIAGQMVKYEKPFVNQNAKFDSRWVFATAKVDLSRLIAWDTQISSHLLDETSSTSLKKRAPVTFNIPPWDDHDLTYPGASEEVPLFELGEYAARDTYWTWRLACEHRARMLPEDRPDDEDGIIEARLGKLAVWCAMPAVASLAAIEQRGFLLDVDWTRQQLKEETTGRDGGLDLMADLYDLPRSTASSAATSKWFIEWTEKAVERGDLHVAALTPNGNPQWSKGVLTRQARAGSLAAQMVLDQRSHTKKAEYLSSWLSVVAPDGSIHATYHAGRVVTGRLSASDPNMQQVTKALKPAFIPRPGFVIIDIDYSQIELRVAAFVSRCQAMIDAFQRGDDLHRMLASRISGHAVEDVTEYERQKGKSANFGLLYLMGAAGFRDYAETAYGVSLTMDEAETIHRAFYEMWDGIGAWHQRAIARVHATGSVVSPIGRVRRLPGVWDGNPSLVGYSERAAVNAPVQGFASDLMQIAAASIQGLIPGHTAIPDMHLLGTVHDSIIGEAPEDRWEEVTRASLDRMLNVHDVLAKMDCVLDVPLAAEATIGTRWGLRDIGTMV